MAVILNIFYFVAILGILVFIHELGHLLAAKAFGVYCKEFAIGMGPKVFSIKKDHWETTYSIRLLPLGGFVSMAGEPGEGDMGVPFERTISGIKPVKRLVVMIAGVTMNLILAVILFFGLTYSVGVVELPAPIIDTVIADTPADKAGLIAGDEIVDIIFFDGSSMKPKDFNQVTQGITTYGNRPLTLEVLRSGERLELELTPEKDGDRYVIGVYPVQGELRKVGFLEAIPIAFAQVWEVIAALGFLLARLFRGVGTEAVGGPIKIFEVTSEVSVYGWTYFVSLLANLSVNLAVINMIPIPVMDGGRSVLIIIEMIIGRPLPEKFENGIMLVGLFLMLLLFVFIMGKDIVGLFNFIKLGTPGTL